MKTKTGTVEIRKIARTGSAAQGLARLFKAWGAAMTAMTTVAVTEQMCVTEHWTKRPWGAWRAVNGGALAPVQIACALNAAARQL